MLGNTGRIDVSVQGRKASIAYIPWKYRLPPGQSAAADAQDTVPIHVKKRRRRPAKGSRDLRARETRFWPREIPALKFAQRAEPRSFESLVERFIKHRKDLKKVKTSGDTQ